MNEATANISWLPFDPRDWEQLTPAFGRLRSMVGAYGSKLIANNRAAAFFDRCVHKERLELALVAPDLTSYRLFDDAERQKLTIRVPLNYEEGCSIEPYHEGHWYVRRSDLEKLTAIPVTPVARAEAERVPVKTPPAPPTVEPGRDVDAADVPVQGRGPLLPAADESEPGARTEEPPPPKKRRGRGRRREKRNAAAEKMRADLRNQRFTPDVLRNMTQDALATEYGCGRETACKARNDVLSEIVGNCRK